MVRGVKRWVFDGRVNGKRKRMYFDKKSGKTKRLQRPRLQLSKAVVFDGGLGPAKKADAEISNDIEIDDAPEIPSTRQDSDLGAISF